MEINVRNENPQRSDKKSFWGFRRLLAVIGLTTAAAVAVEAGPGIIDAINHPSSPENDSASSIDTIYDSGYWKMPLKSGETVDVLVYGEAVNGNLPSINSLKVNEADILSIEGQKVNGNEIEVRHLGLDTKKSSVPLLITFQIDGQTETGIMEPKFLSGDLVGAGNPITKDVHVERNDQGILTETSTGLQIDQVSFTTNETPSTSS